MSRRTFVSDMRTIKNMAFSPIRGENHAERLESFYGKQAEGYDSFRSRLLHGRDELIAHVEAPEGGVWVDLGAGTGENASRVGTRLKSLKQMYLVDLCPSLLKVARERIESENLPNVTAVEADATEFRPPEGSADVVTFSYSLSMIPDWFKAVENALRILKPGGIVGVVDFYVGRKHANASYARHGWFTRTFWPVWFARDNVFLRDDVLPYLDSKFTDTDIYEGVGGIPYLPRMRVPYFRLIGRKPAQVDTGVKALPHSP